MYRKDFGTMYRPSFGPSIEYRGKRIYGGFDGPQAMQNNYTKLQDSTNKNPISYQSDTIDDKVKYNTMKPKIEINHWVYSLTKPRPYVPPKMGDFGVPDGQRIMMGYGVNSSIKKQFGGRNSPGATLK